MSGWDGRATSDGKSGVLPEGALLIELGVGKQLKGKARDSDLEKRAEELGSEARNHVFVFITPRRWRNGASWAATRRKEKTFSDVAVLDADDLEGWLQQCPRCPPLDLGGARASSATRAHAWAMVGALPEPNGSGGVH